MLHVSHVDSFFACCSKRSSVAHESSSWSLWAFLLLEEALGWSILRQPHSSVRGNGPWSEALRSHRLPSRISEVCRARHWPWSWGVELSESRSGSLRSFLFRLNALGLSLPKVLRLEPGFWPLPVINLACAPQLLRDFYRRRLQRSAMDGKTRLVAEESFGHLLGFVFVAGNWIRHLAL